MSSLLGKPRTIQSSYSQIDAVFGSFGLKTLTDDSREHLLEMDANAKPKFQIKNLTRVSDGGVSILKGINLDIPKVSSLGS
ncbi:hypothetical protein VIGAN_11114800 [Vigna angularis var. angularis]|uniref:Uncharacterized protein n=1 Tax=Vigna angularis var. angularis TaxID=157739 RepID=A0A0S3TA28_PHAAN|nr:hypothetical protein VIGAN_11114800 [Vigna angularis var. angularis]